MNKFKSLIAIPVIAYSALFTSCEKENTQSTDLTTIEETSEIPQEILDKIAALAFNTDDVVYTDYLLPDGSYEKRYIVEGDIALSPEYIETMELNGGVQSEQYRTNNLVSPGVITVLGYTGGSNALSNANQTGLSYAVDNYNALNLGITMQLSFGTANYQSYDIVVYKNPSVSGAGGSAGFPSNGQPNQYIQIYGLDNSSFNLNEHVIGHEIGHSIGFRHTDWFSRQSCGQNTNEGTAGVGAVYIPGTPQGYDSTSLMLSCFSGNEDGEFGQYDVVALNYLY